MKKKSIFAVATLITMTISGCSNLIVDDNEKIEENTENVGEVSGAKDTASVANLVSSNEISEKIDNEETFALVIGDETCPACITYNESLFKLSEERGVKIDYIDLNLADEDEIEKVGLLLINELEVGSEGFATPTTFFIVDGKLEESVVGAVNYEELEKTYEEYIGTDE